MINSPSVSGFNDSPSGPRVSSSAPRNGWPSVPVMQSGESCDRQAVPIPSVMPQMTEVSVFGNRSRAMRKRCRGTLAPPQRMSCKTRRGPYSGKASLSNRSCNNVGVNSVKAAPSLAIVCSACSAFHDSCRTRVAPRYMARRGPWISPPEKPSEAAMKMTLSGPKP